MHSSEHLLQLFPYFIETQLAWIPGLEGLFIAAVYSAGISTLTAAYNALTAVTLADVIRPLISNSSLRVRESSSQFLWLVRILRKTVLNIYSLPSLLAFCFAVLAALLALLVERLDTMILQVTNAPSRLKEYASCRCPCPFLVQPGEQCSASSVWVCSVPGSRRTLPPWLANCCRYAAWCLS